ncbi:MAG: hypothetical protein ACLFTP_00260 [Rhodosalinus sp.]|uniref:hypothetical protein n=1 Tax=Rhodosalinus sp. TaxID=2047741 RepID=UPI00397E0568
MTAEKQHGPTPREEIQQRYRERRRDEPAAAPIEADGEAGNPTGRHAGAPVPRDADGRPEDPAREAAARRDPSDVRAGPGDAGAQDKPRVLPERLNARDTDGWRRVLVVMAVGALLMLGLYALT